MVSQKEKDSSQAFRKAAIVVAALDTPSADALLDRLPQETAARIRHAVLQLDGVTHQEANEVIREFISAPLELSQPSDPGVELDVSLAQRMATQAPKQTESKENNEDAKPFRILEEAEPDLLARHLQREHPQVIAVVVAHLAPARAAELIRQLPPPLPTDVLRRVAELDDADPDILRDVEQELQALLQAERHVDARPSPGVATVASILQFVGEEARQWKQELGPVASLVEQSSGTTGSEPAAPSIVPDESPELPTAAPHQTQPPDDQLPSPPIHDDQPHEATIPMMSPAEEAEPPDETANWEFEDLLLLDDWERRRLVEAVDPDVLVIAAAGASETLVQRLIHCGNRREGRALRRRLKQLSALRISDIHEAQHQVIEVLEYLIGQGQIQPPGSRPSAVAA